MSSYKYFIYRIESDPNAEGEYIGPFTTRAQRDHEAAQLRAKRKSTNLHYGVSVYRADIHEDVADTVVSGATEAA